MRSPSRRRGLLVALSLTASAVGCTGGGSGPTQPPVDDAPEEAAPEPELEPEPEPPPPVAGEVVDVVVADLSITNSGLYPDGSDAVAPIPVDDDAVAAVVASAAAWLDAHLTDAQAGGPGMVEGSGRSGDSGPVTAGLTGPARPVTAVSYVVTLGARGAPEWVRVSVEVEREGADAPGTATFVFLPDGEDVALLAVEPAANTAVPDASAPADPEEDA